MGFAGISPGSLLLIFFVALLVFGPKRLESLGGDLGKALRKFRENFESDSEDTTKPSS